MMKPPHLVKVGNGTQLMVDEKSFIALGGEIHNSSSSSLEYMEKHVWDRLVYFNCNTAIIPITWELTEPEEGYFDFSLLEGVINGARKRNLKVILLWFGTWKNSKSTYIPAWVKGDRERFPFVTLPNGQVTNIVSCHSEEACAADAKAFATVMKRIREIDEEEQTVIMVQVENEVGFLGTPRDYSEKANELFNQIVPVELTSYLINNEKQLLPALAAVWNSTAKKGTWREVFGHLAEEVFTTWHISRYVDKVAQAGKQEYELPMFVNAWLMQYKEEKPGSYPSGGPVAKMMNIWKCGAPHIDLLAPDIYLNEFADVCAEYTQIGNPLLIPETRRDRVMVANLFYAIGEHQTLGFTPFGIESMDNGVDPWAGGFHPPDHFMIMESESVGPLLSKAYHLLGEMMPMITNYYGSEKIRGILQKDAYPNAIDFNNYRLQINFTQGIKSSSLPGGGFVIEVSDGEYIIVGHGFAIEFESKSEDSPYVDFISIDEGVFRDGEWVNGRRLNGDEYRVSLGSEPQVLKVSLYSY